MISLFKKKEAPVYPADTVTSRDGRPIVFTFFKHASLAVDFDGRRIYVDPVGEYADYAHLPKADAVLVTHSPLRPSRPCGRRAVDDARDGGRLR